MVLFCVGNKETKFGLDSILSSALLFFLIFPFYLDSNNYQ